MEKKLWIHEENHKVETDLDALKTTLKNTKQGKPQV